MKSMNQLRKMNKEKFEINTGFIKFLKNKRRLYKTNNKICMVNKKVLVSTLVRNQIKSQIKKTHFKNRKTQRKKLFRKQNYEKSIKKQERKVKPKKSSKIRKRIMNIERFKIGCMDVQKNSKNKGRMLLNK